MAEPTEAVGSQKRKLSAKSLADNEELYRVAFDESVRALEQQREEVGTIRTRLVQFLGLVVTATAFLVGSTVSRTANTGERDSIFLTLAAVATLIAIGALLQTARILRPSFTRLKTRASAGKIIEDHIQSEVPSPSLGKLLMKLGYFNARAAEKNEEVLKRLRRAYIIGLVLCGAQLLMWIMLVWLYA